MGFAVSADQSGAVNAQRDMQPFQRDIMRQHVIAALQERGIDRENGNHALSGKSGGHRNAVPLGDCHIEEAFRERLRERVQPGSVGHGGGNGADAWIFRGAFEQGFAENA